MSIEPRREQIEAVARADQDAPVVMLNLLRFAPDGGADEYRRYAQAVGPHLERAGGRVVWQGLAAETVIGPQDESWDMVILVRYPSRKAFLGMVSDPEYLEVAKHRTAALVDSRLVAMTEL